MELWMGENFNSIKITFIEYVFGLVWGRDPWLGSPKTGLVSAPCQFSNRTADLQIMCENTVPSNGVRCGLDEDEMKGSVDRGSGLIWLHEKGMAAQVPSSPTSFLLLLVQEHQQGPEDEHH